MNKLTAIIIDDELHCIETLAWQLEQTCPEIEILTQCESPKEGIKAIKDFNPNVVFLDIEMPKMNGFELLESLEKIDFSIIFTTAFDQFALKAFKVSAVDYLLKPIDRDELKKAVEKLVKLQPADSHSSIQFLLEQMQEKKLSDRVFLPTLNGLEFVEKKEIIRCESDSNYTEVHLIGGKKLIISRTLKEFEIILDDPHFFRIHHSHIVNLKTVQKYVRGDGGHVVMKDGNIIPVSRGKKQLLLDFLAN